MASRKKKNVAKQPPPVVPGLTGKAARSRYKLFVENYFIHNENATAASIATGYSAKTAGQTSFALLRKPEIAAMIAARRAELAKKAEFTAEEVIRSLARAVRFDPRKLYHPDGRAKAVHELDDDTALELEGIDIDTVYKRVEKRVGKKTIVDYVPVSKIKYDLPKKSASRDQAMKHFGLYAKDKQGAAQGDETEPPLPVSVTVEFKDARRKPKES